MYFTLLLLQLLDEIEKLKKGIAELEAELKEVLFYCTRKFFFLKESLIQPLNMSLRGQVECILHFCCYSCSMK